MGDETGVVSAAVFGVQDERQVKRLRLEARALAILADEREEVLGRALERVRIAQHQRVPEMVVGLRLVGVGGHGRESGDELDGLAEVRLDVQQVRRRVVGVGTKHRAGEGVHEVLARRTDDRVLLESVGKPAVFGKQRLPFRQVGEFPEKKQVGALLEPEALFGLAVPHEIADVDAAVEELSGNGHLLAFAHHIAVDGANGGEADQHARAVAVAKPPLHVVLLVQRGINRICAPNIRGTRFQPCRINHLLVSLVCERDSISKKMGYATYTRQFTLLGEKTKRVHPTPLPSPQTGDLVRVERVLELHVDPCAGKNAARARAPPRTGQACLWRSTRRQRRRGGTESF